LFPLAGTGQFLSCANKKETKEMAGD
jgi:hypothetical protein